MNVVTAVAKELQTVSAVTDLASVAKYRLESEVEKTGRIGVVVLPSGNWFRDTQTALFPRLTIQVHADASRDRDGQVKADDAHDRAMGVWEQIDAVLHRPSREAVVYGGDGGVRVLGSQRETEPSFVARPGTTVAMLTVVYDMKVG